MWGPSEDALHREIELNPKMARTYAMKFENAIKSLLKGKAPSSWYLQYRKQFDSLYKSSENTLGIKFLFYQEFI